MKGYLLRMTSLLFALTLLAASDTSAQAPNGDEFTFVRLKYTSGGMNYRVRNPFGQRWPSWAVDYPSAEHLLDGLVLTDDTFA